MSGAREDKIHATILELITMASFSVASAATADSPDVSGKVASDVDAKGRFFRVARSFRLDLGRGGP